MINNNDPRPLYYQIQEYLFKKIKKGDWPLGSKIPSEIDLMEKFNVSRSTVRQAITELVNEGYLERIQGKGTMVREPKITPIAALKSFSENMKAANLVPNYKTLEIFITSPPVFISDFFNLNKKNDNKILYIKRLLIVNNEPIAIQNSYLFVPLIKSNIDLFNKDYLDNNSMYNIIEEQCGIKLWYAEEKINSILSGEEEKNLLNLDKNKPLLVIDRKTYDKNNMPIEFVKLIFRADKYNYKLTLSRNNNSSKGGEK